MNALNLPALPRLISANPHPLEALERHILSKQGTIEICFRQSPQELPALIKTSLDLHNNSNQISIGDFSPYAALLNKADCCTRDHSRNLSS